MPFSSDRGYVAITDHPDGTRNIEIYARNGSSGPSHLVAAYRGQWDLEVSTDVPFRAWGDGTITDEVVEVIYDQANNKVYVRDPLDLATLM